MLVPLSWLADYVVIDRDAESLAAALTSAGLKVEAIHRPGADLPGDVTIGRTTIRGEVSDGMLCSPRELGIAEDHTGILVLPPDAELGMEVTKVLGLDDVILDIEVTTNRPDAMSLLGIAREVAAITGGHVTFPALRMNRPTAGSPPVEELAQVVVEDPAGCPRYLARAITGVTPGPSPEWVAK